MAAARPNHAVVAVSNETIWREMTSENKDDTWSRHTLNFIKSEPDQAWERISRLKSTLLL